MALLSKPDLQCKHQGGEALMLFGKKRWREELNGNKYGGEGLTVYTFVVGPNTGCGKHIESNTPHTHKGMSLYAMNGWMDAATLNTDGQLRLRRAPPRARSVFAEVFGVGPPTPPPPGWGQDLVQLPDQLINLGSSPYLPFRPASFIHLLWRSDSDEDRTHKRGFRTRGGRWSI